MIPNDRIHIETPLCRDCQACTFNCYVSSYRRTKDGRLAPSWCIEPIWRSETGMELTHYDAGGIKVPRAMNFEMFTEVALHELCNDLGLDMWFRLVMQPWFVRCIEMGTRESRGHTIAPSDAAWFEAFMHQLSRREGLGAIFADDLRRDMDELEGELPEELVYLGRELEFNFGFPAHREGRFWDEEPLPFWVISAMMHASTSRDPTIGTHQSSLLHANFMLADRELARRQFRLLSEKVWGYADALEPTFENKAPVAIWSQNQHMLIDSLPLCDFAFPQLIRSMDSYEEWQKAKDIVGGLDLDRRLFEAVTGMALSREELDAVAERAFTLERAMLARAGRGRPMEESLAPHFNLPCRADGTRIDAAGYSQLLDEYYAARSWDLVFGWPQDRVLNTLGIEEVAAELDACRDAVYDTS